MLIKIIASLFIALEIISIITIKNDNQLKISAVLGWIAVLIGVLIK